MKHILKAIDKKIQSLCCSEAHERFDGNHPEADRLCLKIRKLVKVKEEVEAIQ